MVFVAAIPHLFFNNTDLISSPDFAGLIARVNPAKNIKKFFLIGISI